MAGSEAGAGEAGAQAGAPTIEGGAAGQGGATMTEGGAAGTPVTEGGAAGEAGAAGASDCPGCECKINTQRSCAEGGLLGSCAAGTQTCGADMMWGACSIKPKTKDTCSAGNDDTCDGVVNDGCPCVEGAQRPCSQGGYVGKCAAGTQTCTAGATWGACSIVPSAVDGCEAGNNDDCSGAPNEGCLCIEGVTTKDCGVCQDGTQTCTNGKTGQFGACTGATNMKTYYLDADGDGHAVNVSTTICGPAPQNYITGPVDDCYDSNKDAFPGQTKYFSVQRGDGSFDYNCDNTIQQTIHKGDPLGITDCSASCTPIGVGTASSTPACGGTLGLLASCALEPGCTPVGASATQTCH
jgi:hypothetical protein